MCVYIYIHTFYPDGRPATVLHFAFYKHASLSGIGPIRETGHPPFLLALSPLPTLCSRSHSSIDGP